MLHPTDMQEMMTQSSSPLFPPIGTPKLRTTIKDGGRRNPGRPAGSRNVTNLEGDADKFKAVLTMLRENCELIERNTRDGSIRVKVGGKEQVLEGNALQHFYLTLADSIGKSASKPVIMDAMNFLANENTVDPVLEWFKGLKDVEPMGDDEWNSLGQTLWSNEEAISTLITQRFLIMTVARAMNPGCTADWVPIAVGSQGVGKSYTWSLLCPDTDYYGEIGQPLNVLEHEQGLLHRNLINCLEEGDRIISGKGSNTEGFKNLISLKVDEFRKPYAIDAIKVKRAFTFVMTSNRHDFIVDAESRRTLPIRIPNSHVVPVEWIKENLRSLWARALKEYEAHTKYLFSREEINSNFEYINAFRTEDPIEETFDAYVATKDEVLAYQVVEHCLQIPKHMQERKHTRRITDLLKSKHWEQKVTTRLTPGEAKPQSVRLWRRPAGTKAAAVGLSDF